jgi:hypothetical protein
MVLKELQVTVDMVDMVDMDNKCVEECLKAEVILSAVTTMGQEKDMEAHKVMSMKVTIMPHIK